MSFLRHCAREHASSNYEPGVELIRIHQTPLYALLTDIRQNINYEIPFQNDRHMNSVMTILKETADTEEEVFYEQFNAVQERLSDIVIVINDLNAKIGSDKTCVGFVLTGKGGGSRPHGPLSRPGCRSEVGTLYRKPDDSHQKKWAFL